MGKMSTFNRQSSPIQLNLVETAFWKRIHSALYLLTRKWKRMLYLIGLKYKRKGTGVGEKKGTKEDSSRYS